MSFRTQYYSFLFLFFCGIIYFFIICFYEISGRKKRYTGYLIIFVWWEICGDFCKAVQLHFFFGFRRGKQMRRSRGNSWQTHTEVRFLWRWTLTCKFFRGMQVLPFISWMETPKRDDCTIGLVLLYVYWLLWWIGGSSAVNFILNLEEC